MMIVCEPCGKQFESDEMPRRGAVCFGCHVKTIRLGFTHGKDEFHGPTIKERADKAISDARINGYDPQPVGARWV